MSQNNRVLSSLFYKFTERVAVKLIGFIISIVLARLLERSVFGLLAILQVFVNLSQVFVQGGLNVALVQNKDTDDDDYSTVFWISLIIAIFFYIILFFASPLIGEYYSSNDLISPLRVLSISMIFGAFNSVQTAKLSREMQFRKQMICNLVATVISGACGIGLAYCGFGLWALVIYNVLQQITVCLAMLTVANWFPKLYFCKDRAVILFNYGWKILLSNVLYSLYIDIRSLIIGKAYSVDELAVYDRGNQLPNIVSYNLDTAVQSVMLPALSKNQGDINCIRLNLSKMVRTMTFIVTPIMIGIAAVSRPFVELFLSSKWSDCIPYMMIFSVGYIFAPISASCNVAIKAIGKSDVFAKCQAIRIGTLFTILAITVAAFHSVYAIVIGYAVGLLFEAIVAYIPTNKYINYSLSEFIKDSFPNIVVSLVMGAFVYALTIIIHNNLICLVCGILAGIISFLVLSKALKLKAFNEIYTLIMSHIQKRR